MFLLEGRPLSPDRAFTDVNGIQRPANWLRLAAPDERIAAGITEVPDPPTWDQRFYWGYDADGHLIPKDHAQLVVQWVSQMRQTANSLLSVTDWMVIREQDNGTAMPAAWKSYREDVRLTCNNRVTLLGATKTTDQLATVIVGDFDGLFPWPYDPDHPPAQSDEPDIDEAASGTVTGDSDSIVLDSVDFAGGSTTAAVIDSGSAVSGLGSGLDTVTFG
jgi:hypothetical protein